MKLLRPLIMFAAAATFSLAPQMPSQASELVKLGRLIVTGKRTISPVPVDEAKPGAPLVRPSAEPAERPTTNARAPEPDPAAANVLPTDRPAVEHNGKAGLDRGGAGGGAGVSSVTGDRGERTEPLFTLRGLLRAL